MLPTQKMAFGILLTTIPGQQHFKILDQVLLLLAQMGQKVHMVFQFSMSVVFVGSFLNFDIYAQVMRYLAI